MNYELSKKIVFLGSSDFSVYVLDELKIHNILPDLIITTPDKPKGRKLVLTPTPVKIWAKQNNIEVISPEKLKDPDLVRDLKSRNYDLFLVASYGKIIPREIFEIPKHKTLNIHPSLLPKYRGASPIQMQILNGENEVGVTIMQIDEGMDTGPIVIQKQLPIFNFQFSKNNQVSDFQIPSHRELEKALAIEGARLFAHILPEWMIGAIDSIIQNKNEATYCPKIEKGYGEIKLDLNNMPTGKNAYHELLRIKAYEKWPTSYFFLERRSLNEGGSKQQRIIITDATLENPSTSSGQVKLKILKVKPESKSEMPFADFLRGQK